MRRAPDAFEAAVIEVDQGLTIGVSKPFAVHTSIRHTEVDVLHARVVLQSSQGERLVREDELRFGCVRRPSTSSVVPHLANGAGFGSRRFDRQFQKSTISRFGWQPHSHHELGTPAM